MNVRSRTAAVVAAALAVAAGAGGAFAAGGHGRGAIRAGGDTGPVAQYLGLTRAQLRAELVAGKSLAQIATAQGKAVSGLEDVIYNAAQARLDKAVANGRLPAAAEQKLLAGLKSHLDDIVNHAGLPGRHLGVKGPRQLGAAVATYLGLTPAQLRAQLMSGKSLAQIATSQGKTVDGLKAAILAALKTRLDKLVTLKAITPTQEQALLDRIQAHLDDLVNRVPKHP